MKNFFTDSSIATALGTPVAACNPLLVCAVLMPHAPVLVPAIGGSRGNAAAASTQAMREAAARVMAHQPETVLVISPHSPRQRRAFGLWADEQLEGSFAQFGSPEVSVRLPNDLPLAKAVAAEAQKLGVETWWIRDHELDHGALVPLWFLVDAGWLGATVVVSLNDPADGGLTELGVAIAAAATTIQRRVAIVASGDMSHRLTKDAPCGFHPLAHRFDESFIGLVRSGDYRSLQNMDPDLRELAAEDAVDSTLIAAAAANWDATGHKVLGYQGPFGVGYGVAILFEKDDAAANNHAAGASLPSVARRSVETALAGIAGSPPSPADEYLSQKAPVFVTVRHRDGELRGCVGTIVPVCANIVAETWRNARLAAMNDKRFEPVSPDELADLRFEVSVLHSFENISSIADLDPQRFGVVVSTEDDRRGLLLPGIEEIRTTEAQLSIARKKGWMEEDEPVTIQRFQVDRFEEEM
jgi:MEMO1 family protein